MPARPDTVREEVVVHGNFRGRLRSGAANGLAAQRPATVVGWPGLSASVGREGMTAEKRARGLRWGGSGPGAIRGQAGRPGFAAPVRWPLQAQGPCSAARGASPPNCPRRRHRHRTSAGTGKPGIKGRLCRPRRWSPEGPCAGCRARPECDRSVRRRCRSVGRLGSARVAVRRRQTGKRPSRSWRPGTARSHRRLRPAGRCAPAPGTGRGRWPAASGAACGSPARTAPGCPPGCRAPGRARSRR